MRRKNCKKILNEAIFEIKAESGERKIVAWNDPKTWRTRGVDWHFRNYINRSTLALDSILQLWFLFWEGCSPSTFLPTWHYWDYIGNWVISKRLKRHRIKINDERRREKCFIFKKVKSFSSNSKPKVFHRLLPLTHISVFCHPRLRRRYHYCNCSVSLYYFHYCKQYYQKKVWSFLSFLIAARGRSKITFIRSLSQSHLKDSFMLKQWF